MLAATATLLGVAAIALAVFVLLNPGLYASPVADSVSLLTLRQAEMRQQMITYPARAIPEGLPRVQRALARTLFSYSVSAGLFHAVAGNRDSPVAKFLPFDALLVFVGLLSATLALFAGWKQKDESGLRPAGVALVYTGVYFFGISLNMGLDWDRYTLPLWVFAALWAGAGIDQLWRWAANIAGNMVRAPAGPAASA